MDTKIIKKILTATAIVGVVLTMGLLIASLFGLDVFNTDILTKLLFAGAILGCASALAITACGFINTQKILAFITLFLLFALLVLSYIIVWAGIAFNSLFTQITVSVALVTIPFCSIVGNTTKLGKKFRVLQILTYLFVIIAVGLVFAQVWGAAIFNSPYLVYVIAEILVALLFWFILLILGRKSGVEVPENSMVITNAEYANLKNQIQVLQAENAQLKQQLQMNGMQYQQAYVPQPQPYQPMPQQPYAQPQQVMPQPAPQPVEQPAPQPQEVPKNLPKKLPKNLKPKQDISEE